MCTINCIEFGERNLNKEEVSDKRILEVGSRDVNGSLRYYLFDLKPSEYIDIDIVKGQGVDIICPIEDALNVFGIESFDIVISTCTLEHIKDWKTAISNIKNVCKVGGLMLIIVPSVWPYHEYPCDYWRYSMDDIKNIFSDCEILTLEEDKKPPSNVYTKIRKPFGFIKNNLDNYLLKEVRKGMVGGKTVAEPITKAKVFPPIGESTQMPAGHDITSNIIMAEMGISKIDDKVKSIGGLTSDMIRHLLNNLCDFEGVNYLEIGICHGATIISASYKNKGEFTGIDNFTQFDCTEQGTRQNLLMFKDYCNIDLLVGNCWNENIIANIPQNSINIYMYDGGHGYEEQKWALTKYIDKLIHRFCFIVDDWNWEDSRRGTEDAIKELFLNIVNRWDLFSINRENGRTDSWWNGIGIFLLEKT